MKKALSSLLAILILLGMMPLAVLGAEIADTETPKSYRWEIENNTLVSVNTNGNTANTPTLDSGSVSNGAFQKARYTLQSKVQLYHDTPWAMEWRSTGNWSGMLFGSTSQSPSDGLVYLFRDPGTRMFAFGEYDGSWNNYGIILNCDMSVPHTFRLENRIASDGSNEVYLLIDGEEIGAMHHYYITGKYQNKTVNWANGKDIAFGSIGTTSHPMHGMQLEYLQVWENGHDHTYQAAVTAPPAQIRAIPPTPAPAATATLRTMWMPQGTPTKTAAARFAAQRLPIPMRAKPLPA